MGYKKYIDFPHFLRRALWLKGTLTGKVMEIGCAFGFLVKHAREVGIDCYGLDKSEYAISQAPKEITEYLIKSDVKDYNFEVFDWIISWNVLDCLDNEAHAKAIADTMNTSKATQIHILCMNNGSYEADGYFIRDYTFWQKLLLEAYLVSYECGTVYTPKGKHPLTKIPTCWERVTR